MVGALAEKCLSEHFHPSYLSSALSDRTFISMCDMITKSHICLKSLQNIQHNSRWFGVRRALCLGQLCVCRASASSLLRALICPPQGLLIIRRGSHLVCVPDAWDNTYRPVRLRRPFFLNYGEFQPVVCVHPSTLGLRKSLCSVFICCWRRVDIAWRGPRMPSLHKLDAMVFPSLPPYDPCSTIEASAGNFPSLFDTGMRY